MKLLALVLFIVITLGIGGVGGLLTSESVNSWYPSLSKPSWNPPALVFAPVWTVLYILIGVSAWRVWLSGSFWGAPAVIFALQLALNLAWSWIFFYQRQPGLAFFEISLLLLSIVATIVTFGRIDRLAGWILTPYLLWVMFATVLNFSIWKLN